ncbi:YpsA SLOG family protein [Halomonas maura]|uniref:YpsA SLOG family protein n=1 Tax=Halomonas maura TaxID=117606 RepID=UPI0025B49AA3|nr:putative molybdenum carrier protein [Halomonas maura]MDN3557482.1 putative molybdenum carrier protein [Halomonas maura]
MSGPTQPLRRIISGGQSGVDRAALDAALAAGLPCGGWCPPGRRAEDGPIPERYPLTPLEQGGYRQRTLRNLMEADGTLIVYAGRPSAGTEMTLVECVKRHRPYQLIDAEGVPLARAVTLLSRFIDACEIATLNVAGPSAHKAPALPEYVRALVGGYLRRLGG